MASLHRDPRGRSPYFYAAFTLPDGRRAFRSTKKARRKEAEEVARGWERASKLARKGTLSEAQARDVLNEIYERSNGESINFTTTAVYLREWVDSKALVRATGTARRYRDVVDAFIKHLAAKPTDKSSRALASVNPRDIAEFRDEQIRAGKACRTANMAVKTLRIPLNVARRQGLILSNPAEAVELLPERPGEKDAFTRSQITDLLKAADIEWRGMIIVGACHGLRLGDASRLTWANVDLARKALRYCPQKDRAETGQRQLEVPMHPDVEEYLLALPLKSNRPDAPVFPTLSQRRLTGDKGLSNTFARLIETAGIARETGPGKVKGKGRRVFNLGYHSFRHTAISELANAGVAKERRMKLSGHKSNVHERYTHHELEALRGDVEKVRSFVKAIPRKEDAA